MLNELNTIKTDLSTETEKLEKIMNMREKSSTNLQKKYKIY